MNLFTTNKQVMQTEDVRGNNRNNLPPYLQDISMKLDLSESNRTPDAKGVHIQESIKKISPLDLDKADSHTTANEKPNTDKSLNPSVLGFEETSEILATNLKTPVKVADSINNRIESGINSIDISRLKASDYDLNNRESEVIEAHTIAKTQKIDLASRPILEEKSSSDTLSPPKKEISSSDKSKNEKEGKESIILISVDSKNSKNVEKRKKELENRLGNRN